MPGSRSTITEKEQFMSTTTTTQDRAAAAAELDDATMAAAEAEAAAQELAAGVQAGAVTDPAELEQAESRKRFAFLRRKGAQARVAAVEAAERAEVLAALDRAVDGFDGPSRVRAAEDAFAAAVEAAAGKYASVVGQAQKDAGALLVQARRAGVSDAGMPEAREQQLERFIYGSQLHYRHGAGHIKRVDPPHPATHGSTLRALERRSADAIRRGVQTGGTR
jgi:hypothetical protein